MDDLAARGAPVDETVNALDWRPITDDDPPPKNGTPILLHEPDAVGGEVWSDHWSERFGDWAIAGESKPTHWAPMPALPRAQEPTDPPPSAKP